MAAEIFGLDRDGVRRTAETNQRVLGRRPDLGRRTRRRWPHGSGGGGQRVHFTIDSFDEGSRIATCTPRYKFCEGTVPGQDSYGKILVHDPAGCYFNETEAALIGRWGHADWAIAVDDSYAECQWTVSGLCCQ